MLELQLCKWFVCPQFSTVWHPLAKDGLGVPRDRHAAIDLKVIASGDRRVTTKQGECTRVAGDAEGCCLQKKAGASSAHSKRFARFGCGLAELWASRFCG